MVKEYSAEERERAAAEIKHSFGIAERKRPGMGGVAQMYQDIAIDLHCELNRAVELLRALNFLHPYEDVRDFLSRYPEGDKR